jgi:hypothetical protein
MASVPDPFAERDQLDAALDVAARMARGFLEHIGDERVLSPDAEVAIGRWSDPIPEEDVGTLPALAELGERARKAGGSRGTTSAVSTWPRSSASSSGRSRRRS